MVEKPNSIKKSADKKYTQTPIYPTQFNTSAFPNRIYIWAVESFIIVCCVLLLLISIQTIIVYNKIKSVELDTVKNSFKTSLSGFTYPTDVNVGFIYWNDIDQEFQEKHPITKEKYTLKQPVYRIFSQKFVEKYIESRYSIYKEKVKNDKNFCNLTHIKYAKNKYDNCLLRHYSSADIFELFQKDQLPRIKKDFEAGLTRKVVILKNELIEENINFQKSAKDLMSKILDLIISNLDPSSSAKPILLKLTYQTDFAVITTDKDGEKTTSFIRAYTEDYFEYKGRFNGHQITSHGTMFYPYPEKMKKKYSEKIKGEI